MCLGRSDQDNVAEYPSEIVTSISTPETIKPTPQKLLTKKWFIEYQNQINI